jgi:hypothetical protein
MDEFKILKILIMNNKINKYVIKSVTFSVLESTDIRNMSVREITLPKDQGDGGVYDSWISRVSQDESLWLVAKRKPSFSATLSNCGNTLMSSHYQTDV